VILDLTRSTLGSIIDHNLLRGKWASAAGVSLRRTGYSNCTLSNLLLARIIRTEERKNPEQCSTNRLGEGQTQCDQRCCRTIPPRKICVTEIHKRDPSHERDGSSGSVSARKAGVRITQPILVTVRTYSVTTPPIQN